MNNIRYLFYIWLAACIFLLAACGGKDVEPEVLEYSSKAESYAESSTAQQEDIRQNSELTQVVTEIAMEPVNVSCDFTEFSGGSLAVNTDNELHLKISKTLTKYTFEELNLASQPPDAYFIRVTPAQNADEWALTFLEEHEEGSEDSGKAATFLSLMKRGYPEPIFFALEREAFDELYQMANDRVYFVEPPVEEFVEPLKRLLEAYRNGTVENNELEPRFGQFPEDVEIPEVQSAEDFKVVSGNEMASYYAVIPVGEREEYRMVVGMVHMYPASDQPQEPYWTATSASVMTEIEYLQFTVDERYKNRYTKDEAASE